MTLYLRDLISKFYTMSLIIVNLRNFSLILGAFHFMLFHLFLNSENHHDYYSLLQEGSNLYMYKQHYLHLSFFLICYWANIQGLIFKLIYLF